MAKKTAPSQAPKSDERNIVGADQVDIQDLENQMIMLWEKNKVLILGGIGFVFAAFIAFQGLKFFQARAEAGLKAGYQDANTTAAKAAWAEDNASKALGAFALKELGDEAFQDGDFDKAESYYRKALPSLKSPVDEAAAIALAVTLTRKGKNDEAKSLLEDIASDEDSLSKSEARYRLALIASESGDNTAARDYIDAIDDEDFLWKSRGQSLATTLPQS